MHVLILGAGLVARPMVRYLLDQPGFRVTVASRTVSKAEAMIDSHPQGRARPLNVEDEDALSSLVQEADLVVQHGALYPPSASSQAVP